MGSAEISSSPRPIESLHGVGPTRAKQFLALGVKTIGDLLEYFPRDYQYESAEKPIAELVPNQVQMARGEVVAVDYIPARPRPRFEATLDDGSGKLALVWFNSAFLRQRVHPGQHLRVQANVRMFRNLPQMSQAKWELIDPGEQRVGESKFRAVYPASARLSSDAIAATVAENLSVLLAEVGEWFDMELLRKRRLIGRRTAYQWIHCPADQPQAVAARRRLVYDELMLMQLGLGLSRKLRSGRLSAPVLRVDKTLDERIRRRFPFTLTAAQQNAIWQVMTDLKSGAPMNRLLQGDVGSGKTVVAVYAMLAAVANKMQAALLAPTEVLAEQHFLTLSNLLAGSSVKVELITGRTKRSKGSTDGIHDGSVHLAVGTQALLQSDIAFANLGLVVVDEQHKLGVQQRAVLRGKGYSPHYLVMTATPIPRTLALSYFADFDMSTINELPPGRQPIVTRRVRPEEAARAYQFIREQVGNGRQVYVVLPKIDDDGLDDSKSVRTEYDRLIAGPLAGLRLAMLHGQMKTEQKQATMLEFRAGRVDVLVATTVIEVGIDVPNATVMLIGDAERFGLSQLHQLRGRVGRGSEVSYCLLLSDARGELAEARLKAMTDSNDGFAIAELDLQLRGPGQFFGHRQHGLPEFKLADITAEMGLLQEAREDALELLDADPALARPEHLHLRAALKKQLGDGIELAQVG